MKTLKMMINVIYIIPLLIKVTAAQWCKVPSICIFKNMLNGEMIITIHANTSLYYLY